MYMYMYNVNFEIKFAEKRIALFLAVIMNTMIHTLPEGDTYLPYCRIRDDGMGYM